jgi:formamidopyrimidine-DNA glycosylase
MPEGPEVKNITNCLNSILIGRKLLTLNWDENSKYSPTGPDQIDKIRAYLPAQIERVFCKGKQIFFQLISIKHQNRFYFNSGLGMAGSWIFEKGTHSNLWLEFGNFVGNDDLHLLIVEFKLYFDDKRHFGNFSVLWGEESLNKRLSEIGPDLLSGDVTFPVWDQIIKKHSKLCLVSLLMNQAYMSGIGNYLKAEILYRARLKPDRKVISLTDEENVRLWKISVETINDSYQSNGLTIKDYRDPLGRKGSFKILIYNQTHDPEGNIVITSKFSDGRTTHWVPTIQI